MGVDQLVEPGLTFPEFANAAPQPADSFDRRLLLRAVLTDVTVWGDAGGPGTQAAQYDRCGRLTEAYSARAYLTRDRRRAIVEENQYLQSVVETQQEQIDQLLETVAQYENDAATAPSRAPAQPAIR
jgi:hypothetical protein